MSHKRIYATHFSQHQMHAVSYTKKYPRVYLNMKATRKLLTFKQSELLSFHPLLKMPVTSEMPCINI